MDQIENQYHVLNGDALKKQFPKKITGEVIVARECLVDGDVKADSLDELFEVRAKFISQFYGEYSIQEYYSGSVSEFEKIRNIPRQSSINLWFEDDLFCQVNFWFITYLLFNFSAVGTVFLIRPPLHTHYGFGGLNESELFEAFEKRVQLVQIDKIAHLWKSYQSNDLEQLIHTAQAFEKSLPFILRAVEAHLERLPGENSPGRPIKSLREIMKELNTDEFEPVFREFKKRESIYGFGDVQVKRMLDEIKNNKHPNG